MTIFAIVLIILAALMGVPLFLVIAAFAYLAFGGIADDRLGSLLEQVGDVTSQDIFLAIPLFTMAGFLMASAKTPTRLVNLSKAALGWMPGGIAIVALATCAFFTAFTGASGVTIIALGGLLFPIMIKEHYPDRFTLGLLTTGGSRGLLFPPSLPLILYATIAAMVYTPIVAEREHAGPPAAAKQAYAKRETALLAEWGLSLGQPATTSEKPKIEKTPAAPQTPPKAAPDKSGEGEVDLDALEKNLLKEGEGAPPPPAAEPTGSDGAPAPEAAKPKKAQGAAQDEETVDLDAVEKGLMGAPPAKATASEPVPAAQPPAATPPKPAVAGKEGEVDLDALEKGMLGDQAPAAPPAGVGATVDQPTAAVKTEPATKTEKGPSRAERKQLRLLRKRLAENAAFSLESLTFGLIDRAGLEGRQRRYKPTGNLVSDWWAARIRVDAAAKPTPEKLFVAGSIPGVLMVLLIGLYCVWVGVRKRVPRSRFSMRELGRSLLAAGWELPIPLIIIVGLFGGYFTAQEAAGVTAFYVFVVEVLLYRDIPLKKLGSVIVDAMVLVGAIMVILIAALALKQAMVGLGVPETIRDMMTGWVDTKFGFLIILNVFLLIVGCLMDIFSAILVVLPLIVPIAAAYDVHPVHLGIIFLTNLEIGYSTPPVGINLFIASLRFRRPVVEVYRATLPILAILLVTLAVITYWPDLSLWILRVMGMEG